MSKRKVRPQTDLSKYPHMSDSHRIMLRDWEYILNDPTQHPQTHAYFTTMIGLLLDGASEHEAHIAAAKMTGYRLPAFDGDEMGRPADEEGWL